MEHRHNFENELDEQDKKKGAINLEIKDLLKWRKRIWGGLPSIEGEGGKHATPEWTIIPTQVDVVVIYSLYVIRVKRD